jgi:cytochrome c biogenesis protein CcmG, thiol:disulfide interchange protein DsbE
VSQKRLAIGALAIIVLLGLYFFERSGRSRARRSTTAGRRAPDFSLPQLNGELLRLSTYRGKVVLLDFWATWCDPCRDEIPRFVNLENKYGPQGFEIIGISMDDSPDPVRDFYQRFHMNYPVVMGNAQIGELYGGVLGLPIAFLIARDGRIYAKHIGATDASVFEREIVGLLESKVSLKPSGPTTDRQVL